MPGISPNPCACCASAPSQPQSLLIRGVSPDPCGAQVAFRLCRGKVPRPRRSADADFLVKPSGDASAGRLRCICSAATSPSRTSATPAPLLSPPAPACARRPFCTTTCAAATAACGPGAKMSSRTSRTPQGRFLYRTVRRGRLVRQKTWFCTVQWGVPPQYRTGLIVEVRRCRV